MITSQLTSKSQTTVPRAVRQALGIQPGDRLAYEITGNEVVIRRAAAASVDPFVNPFALFTEWASEDDSVYDVLAER